MYQTNYFCVTGLSFSYVFTVQIKLKVFSLSLLPFTALFISTFKELYHGNDSELDTYAYEHFFFLTMTGITVPQNIEPSC
jgi:hypothetical protein